MMRSKSSQVLFLFTLVCILAPANAAAPRWRFTINDGWQFIGSDFADARKDGIETSAWQKVSLPHTWNIADTLDDEPGYRRGISWYRKQLSIGADLNGKRIFLYFEGVNQTADVFVNERSVGSHIGGYTAFAFDITELIKI